MNAGYGDVTMKKGLRSRIAGLVALANFVFFYFLKDYSFLRSAVVAMTTFIAALLIMVIFFRRKEGGEAKPADVSDLSPEGVKRIVEEGRRKAGEIFSLSLKIPDREVRQKVQDLCDISKKIFDVFQKDPKDIKKGKQFLFYYLDSTIKVVKQYVEISGREVKTPDAVSALKKVEDTLDLIKKGFESQLAKLLEDDVMDLDAEISLLEKTLKMEN